ncbi:probable polygalacturonase At1g80170 [Nymphaea colorata]|nr:probable polygalacturonase At1g80170 [Nymphaea colorata]
MNSSCPPSSLLHLPTRVLLLRLVPFIVLCSSGFLVLASADKEPEPGAGDHVPVPPVRGNVFTVVRRGAEADDQEDDAKAFRRTWQEACSAEGPSTMLVPLGEAFRVAPTIFEGPCSSPIHVQISGNLVAPNSIDAWDDEEVNYWLTFKNIQGLTISGDGTINGHGSTWWAKSCKTDPRNPCGHAPSAITISGCTYVRISNLSLVNSQRMHLNVQDSSNVLISNITILAPGNSPNTDGIHLHASQNVYIDRCTIRTGDDCISIVTDSSNIVMTNIDCGPGHGISIGSLGADGKTAAVENIHLKNATFHGTTNGVRIKSWQGGHGYARNILFEQLKFINVSNPIVIDQYYCDSPHRCANKTSAVQVRNVAYIGASGTSNTETAIKLACSETVSCKSIFLKDINISRTAEGRETTSYSLNAKGTTCGTVLPPLRFPSLAIDMVHTEPSTTPTMASRHFVRPRKSIYQPHLAIPQSVAPLPATFTLPAAMAPDGGIPFPPTMATTERGPFLTTVAPANEPPHGISQARPYNHPNHGNPGQAPSRTPRLNPRHFVHRRMIRSHLANPRDQPHHAIPRSRGS